MIIFSLPNAFLLSISYVSILCLFCFLHSLRSFLLRPFLPRRFLSFFLLASFLLPNAFFSLISSLRAFWFSYFLNFCLSVCVCLPFSFVLSSNHRLCLFRPFARLFTHACFFLYESSFPPNLPATVFLSLLPRFPSYWRFPASSSFLLLFSFQSPFIRPSLLLSFPSSFLASRSLGQNKTRYREVLPDQFLLLKTRDTWRFLGFRPTFFSFFFGNIVNLNDYFFP